MRVDEGFRLGFLRPVQVDGLKGVALPKADIRASFAVDTVGRREQQQAYTFGGGV